MLHNRVVVYGKVIINIKTESGSVLPGAVRKRKGVKSHLQRARCECNRLFGRPLVGDRRPPNRENTAFK